jgi:hypothetical protein
VGHVYRERNSLSAEVRRLQQANEDDTVLLGTVAGQRDAAMNAHADALGRIQDYILAADASAKERDAALAERDAAVVRFHDWSGTDVPALNIALTAARQDAHEQRQRAEQAEAALAQAQAKRDSLIKRLDFWIECNNGERANGRMPTFLNPYTILLWIGDKRVAAEADAAQPPALPPLPDDWEPVGAHEHRWKFNGNRVYVSPEGSAHIAEGWYRPADLITVLRHAEAAHQRLKEGQ